MKLRVVSCALASVLCLTSCTRQASDTAEHLSPQQIANRAKPATVEVIVTFNTHGTVPRAELNLDRLKLELDHQRGFFDNKHDLVVKVFDILLSDPGSYLREGEKVEFSEKLGSLGSGFIVTPHGHVLTNAHVVKPDLDEIKTAVQASLVQLVKNDTQSIQNEFASVTGGQIDEERLDHLIEALAKFYVRNMDLDTQEQVAILMPSEPGNSAAPNDPIRCEVLKVGEPIPGKDIAVLKFEGSDLPTLPLAAAAGEALQAGSDLLVDGYPGDVALNSSFTFRSRLQPSLTRGLVSGTKEMEGGWQVIQTDAAVNHGNSGGPALNDAGEVIGLATFKEKDTQGVNFAVSIDVARQFLDSLNIKPEESAFSRDYNQALLEYDRAGHGDALAQFTDLHNRYPNIGTVSEFVRQLSRENASTGSSAGGSTGFPVGLALIGGIVLIGVLILIITNSRRQRPADTSSTRQRGGASADTTLSFRNRPRPRQRGLCRPRHLRRLRGHHLRVDTPHRRARRSQAPPRRPAECTPRRSVQLRRQPLPHRPHSRTDRAVAQRVTDPRSLSRLQTRAQSAASIQHPAPHPCSRCRL